MNQIRRNIAKYTYLRHINTFPAAIPDENNAHLKAGSYYSRPAYIKNNKCGTRQCAADAPRMNLLFLQKIFLAKALTLAAFDVKINI